MRRDRRRAFETLLVSRAGIPLRWAMAMLLLACGGGGGGSGDVSGGASVTVSWDAVVGDPTLAGYRLYYGTAPRIYLQPLGHGLDVGDVTTHQIGGLAGDTTYYFAVTAYDRANNESEFSSEVIKVLP